MASNATAPVDPDAVDAPGRPLETYTGPRSRQRAHKSPPPLVAPDINKDAAERKRVLNVLAQRRYRERRRQSKQTSKLRSDGGSEAGTQSLNQTQNPPSEQGAESSTKHASSLSLELDLGEPRLDLFDYSSTSLSGGAVSPSNNEPNLSWPNISQDLLGIPDQLTRDIALPASPFSNSLSPSGLIETSLATIEPGLLFGFSPSSSPFLPSSTSSLPASFPDSYLLPVSELTLIRAFLRVSERIGIGSSIWDVAAVSPFNRAPFGPPSLGGTLAGSAPSSSVGGGGGSVAARLAVIPPAFQPTHMQLATTHHPLLDLLPWASARAKAVDIFFNLPEGARPAVARGESETPPPPHQGPGGPATVDGDGGGSAMGLVRLAYDMEDSAEGIRVWGSDPYDASAWEVGQTLFARWWFLFDSDIVAQSNAWRRLRGARPLTIGVVEEVG